jgi:hypothetical protein
MAISNDHTLLEMPPIMSLFWDFSSWKAKCRFSGNFDAAESRPCPVLTSPNVSLDLPPSCKLKAYEHDFVLPDWQFANPGLPVVRSCLFTLCKREFSTEYNFTVLMVDQNTSSISCRIFCTLRPHTYSECRWSMYDIAHTCYCLCSSHCENCTAQKHAVHITGHENCESDGTANKT